MRNTTLLLPFALPPAEHARDLLAALQAPSLAMLLARSAEMPAREQPPFAASLPHESLLAGTDGSNSPPVAQALMAGLGVPVQDGYWFVLQPAHFHVARDHLVLTDLRQLSLDEPTSQALFAAAEPLFAELGHEVRYGDARCWFLRADDWHGLRTTTPDAAAGHNVDIWLPSGDAARQWRKLHNEVQMLWHMHPLNESRESRGQHRINALWLWGGAAAGVNFPETSARLIAAMPSVPAAGGPVCDAALLPPSLAGDWSQWLSAMQAIDSDRIAPLLAALRNGTLDNLTLQLTDATRMCEWRATRGGMRKFWRKPSLSALSA